MPLKLYLCIAIYSDSAIQHDLELIADNCYRAVSSFVSIEIVQFGAASRGNPT
jgi:hypothetical protein